MFTDNFFSNEHNAEREEKKKKEKARILFLLELFKSKELNIKTDASSAAVLWSKDFNAQKKNIILAEFKKLSKDKQEELTQKFENKYAEELKAEKAD